MSDRAETGPMQFGDDWPGLFIRGDNAAAYSMALADALKDVPGDKRGIQWFQVAGLVDDLGSCMVTTVGGPDGVQRMVPFEAAMATPDAPSSHQQVPSAPPSGPDASEGLPGPATGHLVATLSRLTTDNRALTDQVTRLQEDSRARLMLTRIRRILLLGDEVPDQDVVDEVDRVAKRATLAGKWSVY